MSVSDQRLEIGSTDSVQQACCFLPSLVITSNTSQLVCYVENLQALQTCKSQFCLSGSIELLLSYFIS